MNIKYYQLLLQVESNVTDASLLSHTDFSNTIVNTINSLIFLQIYDIMQKSCILKKQIKIRKIIIQSVLHCILKVSICNSECKLHILSLLKYVQGRGVMSKKGLCWDLSYSMLCCHYPSFIGVASLAASTDHTCNVSHRERQALK